MTLQDQLQACITVFKPWIILKLICLVHPETNSSNGG